MADNVKQQHEIIGNTEVNAENFTRTTHPDAQWFPQAKLGLFMHWGISSVLGRYDLSWGMMKSDNGAVDKNVRMHGLPAVSAKVTPNFYWEQAKYFNPDNYDPVKWLTAAKNAGMEYAVLTSKHHDGFALWPSDYGDFSTKNYLGGRDLLADYVDACRKVGIKIGFYYSPPDWYINRHYMNYCRDDQAWVGLDHENIPKFTCSEAEQERIVSAHSDFCRGQVKELLTRYGKIDILWFDGRLPKTDQTISMAEIRELQPGILVNPRGHGYGDFKTPECRFPETRFDPDTWWELCYVYSDGAWGYLNHECYKPNGWLLYELGRTVAWGGNFLPNVGPDSRGQLPHSYYQRMDELARWMEVNRIAVKGAIPGDWPERCNVPVTCSASSWYLHVHWTCDYEIKLENVDKPEGIKLLKDNTVVPFNYADRTISLYMPKNKKTILTDIIEVVW